MSGWASGPSVNQRCGHAPVSSRTWVQNNNYHTTSQESLPPDPAPLSAHAGGGAIAETKQERLAVESSRALAEEQLALEAVRAK